MKLLIATILINFGTGLDWTTNLEVAKNKAVSEKKWILLNFSGSDWCGPCIKMKKEVFGSDPFQKLAAEKLVLVNVDFPRLKKNKLEPTLLSNNESIAEKYNKEGRFPLTLLLNANGEVIKEWEATNKVTFMTELAEQINK